MFWPQMLINPPGATAGVPLAALVTAAMEGATTAEKVADREVRPDVLSTTTVPEEARGATVRVKLSTA
jgi:hypothetical protein